MSCKISLLLTGESLLNYLNVKMSAGIFLEHLQYPESLYRRLGDDVGVPDVVIFGIQIEEPIRSAEHILAIKGGISIIILCKDGQQENIQKAIQFSPFLSSEVIAFEFKNKEDLLDRLHVLVDKNQRKKTYAATIAEVERERTAGLSKSPLVANYLNKLLDKIPIGILNLDANGRILNLNHESLALLGRGERELVSTDIQALFPTEAADEINILIANAIQGEGGRNSRVIFLEGSEFKHYLDISISLLTVFTSEAVLTVILQDVTEKVLEEIKREKAEKAQLESEQHLRLVIDAIPELIAYVDADLSYQFNNLAYEKWFGFSRDSIKGKKIWQVLGAKAYTVIEPHVQKVLTGITVSFEEKVSYYFKSNVHIRSTYVPNFSEDGKVCGFILLTSDITDYKNAEEGEKQHMLELAHSARIITVGEMSSQLAHELSQPLTSIETYSRASIRLIEKGRSSMPEIQKTFENISAQAIRAQEVMHELRNFVKKDSTRKNIAINELIISAVKLLEIEFHEASFDIILDLKEDLPLVTADRILIEQVLINLVKNAMEAMEAIDESDRSLTLQSKLSNESGVVVSILDSGPGLSAYEVSKIFEPFYTTKPDGIGMGLAIARSIISSHAGDLHAVANRDGGTTFSFNLPVALTH